MINQEVQYKSWVICLQTLLCLSMYPLRTQVLQKKKEVLFCRNFFIWTHKIHIQSNVRFLSKFIRTLLNNYKEIKKNETLKMILILFWLIGLPTLLWWRSVSWCWPQSVMPSSKWWWRLAVQILSPQISLRQNTVTPWSYSRPYSSSPTPGPRSWHGLWDWGSDNNYWTRYCNKNLK